MKKLTIILSILSLTACGGLREIPENLQIQTEKQLPEINSDSGQLCIFRISNFVGGGGNFDIKANDEYIGELSNSSYFCVNLTPDDYTITAKCFVTRIGSEVKIKKGIRKFMELQIGMTNNLSVTNTEMGLSGIYSTM